MMDRAKKESQREEILERFQKSNAVILTEYRGLTVEEITDLRIELRKASAEFKVYKNRLAIKAIDNGASEMEGLKESLKGPVGIVCSYGDAAQVTKAVLDFEKNHEKFVVKAGYMDKTTVSVKDLKAVADLPSKEVLLGQIVGSLVAPHRGLLGVLNGVSRNLVQVINAIKDKKSQ